MVIRLFLLLSAFFGLTAASADEYAPVRQINSAAGLSNDFVLDMAVDGDGYVWVATEAGVSWIAGNTCQVFPPAEQMGNNRTASLYWHEPTGQMLIGSEKELLIYNPATRQTKVLTAKDGLQKSTLDDIATAEDDKVWLIYGNGQIQSMDCRTLTLTKLDLKNPLSNRCAFDDGHGTLYIGHSMRGMTVVNLRNGSTRHFEHQSDQPGSLPGNNVRQIYQDNQQQIWVGTDNGLARFNPQTGVFTRVKHPDHDYYDNVYDMVQINRDMLWVATDIGGIQTLDLSSPSDQLMYDTKTKVTTSSLNTRCLMQDEYGNIWVGNHCTGVDFFSTFKQDFHLLNYLDENRSYRPIYAITPDTNTDGFWMMGEDELTYWQGNSLKKRWEATNNTSREHLSARTLMADHAGNLWMGINDCGVFRFDKATGRSEEVTVVPEGFDILSFGEDNKGRIWIGGEFAVYYYDKGQLTREETISQTLKVPAIYFEQLDDNLMFVATIGDGAYLFNIKEGTHLHLDKSNGLPSNNINQVVRDRHKGMWLATNGGLVYMADPEHLSDITVYDKRQGLADVHLLALQQDTYGHIWMSTYNGISCFVKGTEKFYNYNHIDTHQPSGFSIGASMTDTQGNIYFGSADGVCYFNPQQMNANQVVSDVQIITLEAYNPVGSNTEILLLTPDENGKVYTTYQQNTLKMTFTVRNFSQTEYVEYSYMMKGMDNKWYEIGNDHDVVFRGLRPGDYTFILRARLKGQDWNEAQSTRVDITIAPPFWRTWWAYLLYAVILALWILWLIHSYKRRLTLRNTLELEKRESQQKQELNEERLRFFTNVTHELRTPLTLILGPLDELMGDQQLSQPNRRRVSLIQKNAQRLQNLINDVLDFRKTETHNRRLSVAKGDVGQFVKAICLNFKELYRNPKVKFNINIATDLPKVFFDSEVITTILNNFLSNAIKYTDEGSISVSVSAKEVSGGQQMVDITVADTGYGISPQALPHIFERYYQAEGKHQASGTGIGLALVKSLADLHQAELKVESSEGSGSRFTLSLAVDNTYPEALHKEDVHPDKSKEQAAEVKDGDTRPILLIVEDNSDIREYISDSFSDDFQILQAENGEEGLKQARMHIPDMIVSDIMMPFMNGIDMTRQLKSDITTSHIPVILLTAKVTDEDKEAGYDCGADSYLTKPFTAKLLGSRIQNILSARRQLADYLLGHSDNTTKADIPNQPSLSRIDREFLEKLNEVIETNITTEDIDMAFMTDKMAMSHSTFYRKVKALTGMTAKDYIRKFRLNYCYKLLKSGDYNVNQAAMMTGFNQMAHFREIFKQEFGILPSEVKKK